MNFIGENLVMDRLHHLPRPAFVEAHPWAIYDGDGNFHSRYKSAACAARSLVDMKGAKFGTVINEQTGEALDFAMAFKMVRVANREVAEDLSGAGRVAGKGPGDRSQWTGNTAERAN